MRSYVTAAEIARLGKTDVRAVRKIMERVPPAAVLLSGRKILPLYSSDFLLDKPIEAQILHNGAKEKGVETTGFRRKRGRPRKLQTTEK
jgi:hypothetical protein